MEPFGRLPIYLLGPRWLLGSFCFNTNGRQSRDTNRFLLQIVGRRGAAVQIEGMGFRPVDYAPGSFYRETNAAVRSDRRDRVTCEGKRRTIESVV